VLGSVSGYSDPPKEPAGLLKKLFGRVAGMCAPKEPPGVPVKIRSNRFLVGVFGRGEVLTSKESRGLPEKLLNPAFGSVPVRVDPNDQSGVGDAPARLLCGFAPKLEGRVAGMAELEAPKPKLPKMAPGMAPS
jgi:hypothetical protein